MAIPNQGYRIDLNLKETEDTRVAIDALGGAGISNDIRLLQNNLRNTSEIGFNAVDAQGFFSFKNDKTFPFISEQFIVSSKKTIGSNSTSITIEFPLSAKLEFKLGDTIELSGMTDDAAALNGLYPVLSWSGQTNQMILQKSRLVYVDDNILPKPTVKLRARDSLTFTNGDVITLSHDITFIDPEDSTITPVEFLKSKTYYVVNSNAVNEFKLSETSGGSAISLPANAVSSSTPFFTFIRNDTVYKENLINYIEPDYFDTGLEADDTFSFLEAHGDDVNTAFDETAININQSTYSMSKKYRGDVDMSVSDSVKIQGNVSINDPANNNSAPDKIGNDKAPGIYIGGTRAFSSDNNPWRKQGSPGAETAELETSSDEVKIGELAFLDGGDSNSIIITGQISGDVQNAPTHFTNKTAKSSLATPTPGSFTHKLPVTVQDELGNQETYYLLLSDSI